MMNTPKYSVNNNRNVSPLRTNISNSTPLKSKQYSTQQVTRIIKTNFEPKVQFLMQQLQDRQQIIARLNNKLNQNDQKLLYQASIIDSLTKKQKDSPQMQEYISSIISQILNQKIKQLWQAMNGQIRQVVNKISNQYDGKKIQAIVNNEIQKIKTSVDQFINNYKTKSNGYWQKIKDALQKINTKINGIQNNINQLNNKINIFQQNRTKERQSINEILNGKGVAKNLIQLKKSVNNIYQNYQSILSLQNGLKRRIQDENDVILNETNIFKNNQKLLYQTQQIIALQYSKQDIGTNNDIFLFQDNKPIDNRTQPITSPVKSNIDKSYDLINLQKTNPLRNQQEVSQIFSLNTSNGQGFSRFHNNTVVLNNSLETRKEMCQGVRQRLLELIEVKKLQKPLQVRYDQQINYLKTSQGNYLFDLKCNMFKLNMNDLIKLEEQGIVYRGKNKKNQSTQKLRKTALI